MKFLIPWLVLTLISWLVGALVWLFTRSPYGRSRRASLWLVALFAGPMAILGFQDAKESYQVWQLDRDRAYVNELCATQGGDKIYRTVDNVEGVLQMKPRPQETDEMWRDQFGMPDPWGRAQGDGSGSLSRGLDPAISLGKDGNGTGSHGYWFLEQRVVGSPQLLRRVASSKGETLEVTKLRSRYGYLTEDISTRDMRKRWIAGGRIKIIDLQTNEVLAMRTGFFRAAGPFSPMRWEGASAYQNERICPQESRLNSFLVTVLKPPINMATDEQLKSLSKD